MFSLLFLLLVYSIGFYFDRILSTVRFLPLSHNIFTVIQSNCNFYVIVLI